MRAESQAILIARRKVKMSPEEYRSRILAVERYCEKLSFLCPKDCHIGDFWAHAERVSRDLTDCVEADFYGAQRLEILNDGTHLYSDTLRHLAYFDRLWGNA